MDFAQVIADLPALSRLERRELALRIMEIDSTDAELDDMAVCEQSVVLGFAMLERMEAEDEAPRNRGKSGRWISAWLARFGHACC